jgi:hypothetical protein
VTVLSAPYGQFLDPSDMGMHFGYPQINIPGLAHYEGGSAYELDKIDYIDLETNPSLVAYIKRGRGTLERYLIEHHRLQSS